MTTKVQGQVYKVHPKEFPGKNGRKGNTWYSIKLEDDDIYYRCKAERYAGLAEEGNFISFEHNGISSDGKSAEVVPGSVKKIDPPKSAPAVAAAGGTGTTREASIHYQSARKDAIQLVDVLVRTGAVKLPAKEANKLEALEALVDRYTSLYFFDTATFGAVARANGEGGESEEAVADEEEEE